MTQFVMICVYLMLLVGLGLVCSRFFKGTAKDYFVTSHSIGWTNTIGKPSPASS